MFLSFIKKTSYFSLLLILMFSCQQSSSSSNGEDGGNDNSAISESSDYSISLNTSGLYSFIPVAPSNMLLASASVSGYKAGNPGSVHTVEITNTGNKNTGNLNISVSGPSAAKFSVSKSYIPNISPGGVSLFDVIPKTSLPEGDYTAIVTVTGNNIRSAFSVKQSVSPLPYYTVSFDSRGAGLVPSQYIRQTELLEPPIEPSLSGYVFDGWYTDTLYTDKWDFDNDVVLANILLFAKWSKSKTYLSVRFENFNNLKGSYSVQVEKGTTVSQPETLNSSGYTFVNWYTEPQLATIYNFNWPVEENIVLYARWLKDVFPVKFYSVLPDDTLFEIDSYLASYNGRIFLSEVIPTKEAHHFTNWYIDIDRTIPWDFENDVVTEPVNLYADFEKDVYVVRFDGGLSTNFPNEFTVVDYGTKIVAPVGLDKDLTMSQYYTFSGWYTGLQDGYAWDFDSPVTKSMVLYARWIPRVFTITFDTNNSTTLGTKNVEYGGRIAMPSTTPYKYGLYFYGWSTAPSGGQVFDFNAPVLKDTTVYAIYYAVLTFFLGDQYAGQQVVTEGDTIEDIDVQLKFFTLDGWYSEPNGIGDKLDFSKPITAHATLYSNWIPKDYTLVVDYAFGVDTSKPEQPSSATYTINWNTLGSVYMELLTIADNHLVRDSRDTYAFLGWTWKRKLANWYELYINHQHYETIDSVSVDFSNAAFFETAKYTDIVPVTDEYGSVSVSDETPVLSATIYALWTHKYQVQFTRYDEGFPDAYTADGLRREIPAGTRIDPKTDWDVWVVPGELAPIPYEVIDWFRQKNKRIKAVWENDSTHRWWFNKQRVMGDVKLGVEYDNNAFSDTADAFYGA
jgi:uncharacterized repeat protein (TIGR02543 family)